MKIKHFLFAILIGFVFITACSDDVIVIDTPKADYSIIGKWKLVALVDIENNTSRPPDLDFPDGDIFTLLFDTIIQNDMHNCGIEMMGYYVSGVSSNNTQNGIYQVDYITNKLTTCIGTTKAGEISADGNLYYDIFIGGNEFSFELNANELRLFYTPNNYLLFSRR